MFNLLRTRNEMDLFEEDFLKALLGNHPVEELFLNNTMKTDVEVNDNKYIFTIELPSYKKEELKISFEKGYLTVAATKNEKEKDSKKYILKERTYKNLSRTYYVGEDIDEDSINAQFENGILKIVVSIKEKEEKKKSITVE